MIMKKLKFVFACLFLIMLGLGSFAVNATDYFAGKWSVLVSGTPNGDSKMIVSLEQKDGKLIGTVTNQGATEATKFTNVEEKENSVTAYFSASGYDVYLVLEKKDENHVTGSMMDMFDCTGVRIVETNTEAK